MYSIEELEKIAKIDQTEDASRGWNYTGNCYYCGGVEAFINWLKENRETIER